MRFFKKPLKYAVGSILLFLIFGLYTACKSKSKDNPKILTNEEYYMADTAIQRLTQMLEGNPNQSQWWFERSQAFHRLGGFDEAISDLENAIRLDSLIPEYYIYLSNLYVEYFKSKKALNTLYLAHHLMPENQDILLKLAELQLVLQLHDESMKSIDLLLRQDPQHAYAYYLLGKNLKEIGDTARAVGSFQKSVNFDPDQVDAWINLGLLRAARGEINVIRYFDAAILADKNGFAAKMAKAEYLWKINKLEDAKALYREIIQNFPESHDNHFNLGLVLLEQDSTLSAREHFNITLNIVPYFYKALYYRGLTYELEGKKDSAKADYLKTLEIMPNFEKAKLALESLGI